MKESDSDTIIMVIVLVAGVGGVFLLFALMALCYRFEKISTNANEIVASYLTSSILFRIKLRSII